ncbi:MAG: tryptophan 2,3-dioxygenase family protein [Phycisphaerales bacterium]|nr:tryptophan 2,3-dioxygenase family protein [Phycisphaerales bacterium]
MSYGEYLKVNELLDLQQPRSEGPEHDEMLFIVIHQVYELWFKQQLHEADHLCNALIEHDSDSANSTLVRMLTILKTMVGQIDVLETMTPVSFLSFRDFLASASGFQSSQFREFEFVLGHKRAGPLNNYPEGSPERTALEQRLQQPSVWRCLLTYLSAEGIPVPASVLDAPVEESTTASPELQTQLLEIYHNRPRLRELCERFVDLDEGIQEWRYRHVKMVERTIGFKKGTGGSPGAAYLRTTLFAPLFPDLWDIRSEL